MSSSGRTPRADRRRETTSRARAGVLFSEDRWASRMVRVPARAARPASSAPASLDRWPKSPGCAASGRRDRGRSGPSPRRDWSHTPVGPPLRRIPHLGRQVAQIGGQCHPRPAAGDGVTYTARGVVGGGEGLHPQSPSWKPVPASSARPSRASAGTFRSRRSRVGAVA